MLDAEKTKSDFPIFQKRKPLVYLDSAATSQKPTAVLEAMDDFYQNHNANVHRGVYKISEEATERYENARKRIGGFIGTKNEKEMIYTRSATEAINLVMRGYGEKFIKAGGRIVVSVMEHHSNFVPWQRLAEKKKAKLEVIDIDENGELNEEEIKTKIKGARIVAVSHLSNVLGTVNDVKEICKLAHEAGAICVVDGAQSVPHMAVDVQKLGCDFLVFSGHKMLGPDGIGILYGKEEHLEAMDPMLFGGEMISKVKIEKTEWNALPYKFEAGTMPVAEAVGLGAAVAYLEKRGMENIEKHGKEVVAYAMEKLHGIKGITVYGPQKRIGVVAFNLNGIHAHDVATVLDERGIAVRSGHHCTMPLHERLDIPASARASFYIYNGRKDVDALCEALQYAKKVFKV